jgi:hypothetical protein
VIAGPRLGICVFSKREDNPGNGGLGFAGKLSAVAREKEDKGDSNRAL